MPSSTATWGAWKVTMKSTLSETVTEPELERFRELAGRDPPPGRGASLDAFLDEMALETDREAATDAVPPPDTLGSDPQKNAFSALTGTL